MTLTLDKVLMRRHNGGQSLLWSWVFLLSLICCGCGRGALGSNAPIHGKPSAILEPSTQMLKVKTFQSGGHPNDILASMESVRPGFFMQTTHRETIQRIGAVQGSSVNLPCNITPPIITDKVRLVLFFRNDSKVPIYTYDTRGQSHVEARHWSDEKILGSRAFFRGDESPGRLVLDTVQPDDGGIYRCRVDFYRAPTTIESVMLDIIVPPEKPKIYDERNQEVRLKLGPYKVGDEVALKCISTGGNPSPKVSWWRDHALLDDISEEVTKGEVVNNLRLLRLTRTDLHSILTCQASNNNLSVPVSTSVKLDMHFGPVDVKMIGRKDPVSAGRVYEFRCQAVGARPPPEITWWRGSTQLRENVTNRTSPDGNVTLSIINYVPSVRDAGKYMSCKAENPEIPDSAIEDGWKLDIHYVPQSILSLGTSLNGSNIKEGDDVYFECNVRANPKPYKITWRFNENPLLHNVHEGIIVSNHSLVLQDVRRTQSGIYTCLAHNIEGDGASNPMTLNIRYAPYCKPDQVQVFGVARDETVRISCEVISNPIGSTSFEWRFNASGELVDMPHDRFKSTNTKSIVEYVPRTELDYGSLMCWAKNSIGKQRDPCIFHLVPAGTPDSVKNCSFGNQTTTSFEVRCMAGYDGGLPQTFVLEAKDNHHYGVVAKLHSPLPHFNVTGLEPGRSYVLSVYAQNSKGLSNPVTLYSFTIKEAEKHTAGSTHPANVTSRDGVSVTPILGILVAIACGLALVAVAIIVVLRIRPVYNSHKTNRPQRPGMSGYPAPGTHIPLNQREIDECIDMDGKMITGGTPDLIQHNKNYMAEASFQNGVSQNRRYAASATLQRRRTEDPDFERRNRIRNNFSRLSQEVTYAEFTMPRNKGYAPMKARSTDSPVPVPNVQAQYSTGVRNPPPMPPPRYTAPPTAEATPPTADDDPFASEMPLVSFQP